MNQSLSPQLGGKALNLINLKSIPGVIVPPFVVLTAQMSEAQCREVIADFLQHHPVSRVAVRSSATQEDSYKASFAGVYDTKLDVLADSEAILNASREIRQGSTSKSKVIAHYVKEKGLAGDSHSVAVIVQEMVSPDVSGVIFSHSLSAQDGYYSISLAKGHGGTVVSGLSNGELIRIVRTLSPERIGDTRFAQLVTTMDVIEKHYQSDSLDVEFAFVGTTLYILQCRPITTAPLVVVRKEDELKLVHQLAALEANLSQQYGGDVLGDMIDINPLELLGQHPSALDISLFRFLFADSVVERVRREMGYDPLDVGLIRVVGSKPYVSLRASAFSFRPQGVSAQVYDRLFEVYREQVEMEPSLQSSVEFAVFAMGRGARLQEVMRTAGLSVHEQEAVRESFRALEYSLTRASEECVRTLEMQIADYAIQVDRLSTARIQDVLKHVAVGTEQFVRVARLAFYWKSRFEEKYPTEVLNELIVGHLRSVSTRMHDDLVRCSNGTLAKDELVARYGHLRPGQFSTFGEAYADDPEHYLFSRLATIDDRTIVKRRHAYEGTVEFKNVVTFMQAREETKFLFSQVLHMFSEQLAATLHERGITQSQAAKMDWQTLSAVLSGDGLSQEPVDHDAELPKHLPEVIVAGKTRLGVTVFGEAVASYVTTQSVKAFVQCLQSPDERVEVRDKLVLIPYADPGYDFLFHSGVKGIISRVGGPASHMCIRAIELQVPACIGCGERVYDALSSSSLALLDCASRQIIPL